MLKGNFVILTNYTSKIAALPLAEQWSKVGDALNTLQDLTDSQSYEEPVKLGSGRYKTESEPCFIKNCHDVDTTLELRDLAKTWGQESILRVTAEGYAVLLYTDGKADEYVGKWTAVSPKVASEYDNATYVDGQWYVTVKN